MLNKISSREASIALMGIGSICCGMATLIVQYRAD